MWAEDFGWLLSQCLGACEAIGNGTEGANGCALHSPGYDFHDDIIPIGIAYWVNLVNGVLSTRNCPE